MNWKNTKKYYCIYKITNKLNEKIYIGFHSTNNLDDDYMGSGKYIRRAIKKYGIENFEKEIIRVFDNKEDAENLERELVNEEFIKRDDTYNISIGGNVCILFGEANGFYGKKHTEETRKRLSEKSRKYKHTEEAKEKISISSLEKWKDENFKEKILKSKENYKHSEETKLKISNSNKGKQKSEEHKKNLSISRLNSNKCRGENHWTRKNGGFSEEHKKNMSISRKGKFIGKDNPNYGNGEKVTGKKNGRARKIFIITPYGNFYCHGTLTKFHKENIFNIKNFGRKIKRMIENSEEIDGWRMFEISEEELKKYEYEVYE